MLTPRSQALVSLAVIAMAIGATAIARGLRPPPPPPPAESNEPVFAFDPGSVRSIDVRTWQGTLRAERASGGWRLDEVRLRRLLDEPAEAGLPRPAPGEIDRVVSELVREIVELPVIDRFPLDGRALADYGLEEPQATISLGLADGATRRLEVGSLTLASTALYARATPPDDVVEVGTGLFGSIDAALYRLRALATPIEREPGAGGAPAATLEAGPDAG